MNFYYKYCEIGWENIHTIKVKKHEWLIRFEVFTKKMVLTKVVTNKNLSSSCYEYCFFYTWIMYGCTIDLLGWPRILILFQLEMLNFKTFCGIGVSTFV
jgi:hypothetical protein